MHVRSLRSELNILPVVGLACAMTLAAAGTVRLQGTRVDPLSLIAATKITKVIKVTTE